MTRAERDEGGEGERREERERERAQHEPGNGELGADERHLQLDETLQDEPLQDEPHAAQGEPAALDKTWLMEQRFVHGLLRAMSTADAQARQARIARLLSHMPGRSMKSQPRRLALAAAAVMLASFLAWWLVHSGEGLPRAEAMVARAVVELARPVGRRFEMVITRSRAERPDVVRHFELTTHPGKKFLLEGSGPLGSFHAGCDGETVWLLPDRGMLHVAVPLSQAHDLEQRFGDFLNLGYVDVGTLIAGLPATCEMRTVSRERAADGRPMVRVEAVRLPARAAAHVQSAFLIVEEATGQVTHVEIVAAPPENPARKTTVVFDYRGIVELDPGAYRRPW